MIVFENLIRKGKSLMLRMEKQIKHGVDSLPEKERVIVGEDTAWLKAAQTLVETVFGLDSTEAKSYRQSMKSEFERVEHWRDKGFECSHGDWNIWLIGHGVGLLAPYEHYPEPHQAQKGTVVPSNASGAPISIGSVHMGDSYVTGQAGAVGPHSMASHNTFQQLWLNKQAEIDLPALANELDALRKAMRNESTLPEHDIAIGEVAAAQGAANAGDGPNALEHLKKAGKWSFDTATKIGVTIVAKAIQSALGF